MCIGISRDCLNGGERYTSTQDDPSFQHVFGLPQAGRPIGVAVGQMCHPAFTKGECLIKMVLFSYSALNMLHCKMILNLSIGAL